LPDDVVGLLKAILKAGTLISARPEELQIERSLPHGHVAAALGMVRKIALDRLTRAVCGNAPSVSLSWLSDRPPCDTER
jgi:hypothetical protein